MSRIMTRSQARAQAEPHFDRREAMMEAAFEIFNREFWPAFDAGKRVGGMFKSVLDAARDFPGSFTDAFWPDASNDSPERTLSLDILRTLLWCAHDNYYIENCWGLHWCGYMMLHHGFTAEQVAEIKRRGEEFNF